MSPKLLTTENTAYKTILGNLPIVWYVVKLFKLNENKTMQEYNKKK